MGADGKSRGSDPEKRRRAMQDQARARAEGHEVVAAQPKPRGEGHSVQTMTGTMLPPITRRGSGEFDRFDSLPHMPRVLVNIQTALKSGKADAKTVQALIRARLA